MPQNFGKNARQDRSHQERFSKAYCRPLSNLLPWFQKREVIDTFMLEIQSRMATNSPPVQDVLPLLHKRSRISSAPKHLQSVDLFCGAGGLSEGLHLAGFDTILGVDAWEPACVTFASNQPTANVIQGDISQIPDSDFLENTGLEPREVGLVCGGPPCQGFSLAGTTLADDPRNYLYKHFLRAVSVLQPAWVIMENVPSLLSNELIAPAVLNDFRTLETSGKPYDVTYANLNAAWFGVPQTRTRLIFLAKRSDVKVRGSFDFREAIAPLFVERSDMFGQPAFITCWEAISDLPLVGPGEGQEEMPYDSPATTTYQKLMRGDLSLPEFFEYYNLPSSPKFCTQIPKSGGVFNHVAQEHNSVLVERFKHIPPGGSKEDLRKNNPELLPPEGHPEQGLTYGRLWLDRPASAIPANYSRPSGNRSIHPVSPRLITPREALRLSSFPDCYRLSGLKVAQREQVGNAVPPLMAFHLAQYIHALWDRD